MEKVNIGSVVMNVLNILILKIFTLPIKIYKNALIRLSSTLGGDKSAQLISKDFPIYSWFISVFDAIIILTYPLGLLWSIYAATGYGGFKAFLVGIVGTYFLPLYISLVKELLQITLKMIEYLKMIAHKGEDVSSSNQKSTDDILDEI